MWRTKQAWIGPEADWVGHKMQLHAFGWGWPMSRTRRLGMIGLGLGWIGRHGHGVKIWQRCNFKSLLMTSMQSMSSSSSDYCEK